MIENKVLMTITEASKWATSFLKKNVTTSNISYLIQYGRIRRYEYIQGISEVLRNCARFLDRDYDVFLVANDKFTMYPTIAERSGMRIVNQYKRPVLNRTEKNKAAYSESIFHLKF